MQNQYVRVLLQGQIRETIEDRVIDLVLVNQHVYKEIMEVTIDEKGLYKPANYEAKAKKVTDHNTILLKVKVEKSSKKKQKPYRNTKCEGGRERFCQVVSQREQ